MPTAVVLNENDDEFHFSHPEEDNETFCGETYSYESAERVASFGARYKDDVAAQVATEEDKNECEDCARRSDEWADE